MGHANSPVYPPGQNQFHHTPIPQMPPMGGGAGGPNVFHPLNPGASMGGDDHQWGGHPMPPTPAPMPPPQMPNPFPNHQFPNPGQWADQIRGGLDQWRQNHPNFPHLPQGGPQGPPAGIPTPPVPPTGPPAPPQGGQGNHYGWNHNNSPGEHFDWNRNPRFGGQGGMGGQR